MKALSLRTLFFVIATTSVVASADEPRWSEPDRTPYQPSDAEVKMVATFAGTYRPDPDSTCRDDEPMKIVQNDDRDGRWRWKTSLSIWNLPVPGELATLSNDLMFFDHNWRNYEQDTSPGIDAPPMSSLLSVTRDQLKVAVQIAVEIEYWQNREHEITFTRLKGKKLRIDTKTIGLYTNRPETATCLYRRD